MNQEVGQSRKITWRALSAMARIVRPQVTCVLVLAVLVFLFAARAGRTESPKPSTSGQSRRDSRDDSRRPAAAYDTWKRIKERGVLTVSMDPANLPYSGAEGDRPGFDVEIAQALARELNVKLRLGWIDVLRETAIGELLDGECDLAMGAVLDPGTVDDDEELTGKVIYSRPYYGTGYMIVTRQGTPRVASLTELKGDKSRRLGTDAGSVADYRLRQRGYLRRLSRTQLSVLKSLHDGGIDYAYLWANVGWILHATPEFELEMIPRYVPEDHWNVAIAMRRDDGVLKHHVDVALEKLVSSGEVSRALARYHVPYFPAFADDAQKRHENKTSAVEPRHQTVRRPVTDRGLEPQKDRRRRSKKGYGGLARVRSAGVLVVGLDHNNLPFSALHPEPAGLDYEIAQLLAEELGVSLRVYWAYSSHDSYASKLATKKLCDVMLGVIPDDRFGKRVLYSKPYYVARYQLVVATDDKGEVERASGPWAVESALAIRGLDGRQVVPYPSLAAVLEAVATGEMKTGYVLSTRGHWLTAKRWSGTLKFIDAANPVEQFPIFAAVRKTDPDLKKAIDRAFDDLAQSGRLADVFARWQIPYVPFKHHAEPLK